MERYEYESDLLDFELVDPDLNPRLANEYEIGRQLDHPVIRKVHRLRRIKRWMALREVHLVMEFCEGRNLQDERPSAIVEVVRIFSEVAGGLAYMNARGFVHAR